MQRGFTLKELIVVCFIFGSLIPVVLPALRSKEEHARMVRCKANLDKIGKPMKIYLLDYGRNVVFPERDGAGFLTTFYHYSLIDDPDVFICPSTSDTNNDGEKLANITGPDPDNVNAVSYGARKNSTRSLYPGFFRPQKCGGVTSMAADDLQSEENHIEVNIFLFLDGHSDHIRSNAPRINGLNEDIRWLYDPLTN